MTGDDTVEVRPHEGGYLVLTGATPIGFITPQRTIQTPAGAEHSVREGRGAARLWSDQGQPLATYDREPTLCVKDEGAGTVWELRPDWREAAAAGPDGATLPLARAFAVPYTLEEAQGAMPARVKLLLAWLMTREAAGGSRRRDG